MSFDRISNVAMSDPTPSKLSAAAGSFESRLSRADGSPAAPALSNKDKELLEPKKIDWADEVATPTDETPPVTASVSESDTKNEQEAENDLRPDVPEHDVEVKLADMQGDEANPLYSIASFEELGMYVFIPGAL